MKRERIIIMGAAGRDFHNFNVCFRDKPAYRVVAFTAAQIPFIANRHYPPVLAGSLYPRGIPIHDESRLEDLIRSRRIDRVIFAYSDISYAELMHKASVVHAAGADFSLLGPDSTMLQSSKPVISVCAVRTGCGKSQVVRYLCTLLAEKGIRTVVVRHPMPYGNLEQQVSQRYAEAADVVRNQCTIEEREEFEPLLNAGAIVYAGVDYRKILRSVEKEAEVIIWDGGNNDLPFYRPDLEIVIADPLRAGDESGYWPGEANVRRAQVILVNKVNAADEVVVKGLEGHLSRLNPGAAIIRTRSMVTVRNPGAIQGKRVLVVEDGPTTTHGGMASGAGLAAARAYRAGEILDPRPYAVGSLADIYRQYPHIGPILPAMGYSDSQVIDLEATINSIPCDVVISGTPIDIAIIMNLNRAVERVYYDLEEVAGGRLKGEIDQFLVRTGV